MNDDEFDKMVREQHRLFIADISRAVESRPVPVHVPPRSRVLQDLSAKPGGAQPGWWGIGVRIGATLVASGAAVVALIVSPVQSPQRDGPAAAPPPSALHPGSHGCPCAGTPGPAKFSFPVLFRPDSAELTPEARDFVTRSISAIHPTDRIVVVGHTARIGDAESARAFSVRRAQAVADLLTSLGIAEDRLTVRGAGFDESPPGDDARSRRVEVDVVAPD
ncbi:OmpA family protein [Amycolatopsis vancoresmycina]|uniref:Outer membrane protein A n=1 Tax=Amycolatopsis vancoresmycina DSM 44592 TaxID=1292037 RepID=R1G0P6_9PSEU|nr:OmpA family protein [Amycolatopsis vancoresmycina]EOD65077.1 outer membrane protein A [Amycolatopsis vancoresmycina DSM 44592]